MHMPGGGAFSEGGAQAVLRDFLAEHKMGKGGRWLKTPLVATSSSSGFDEL